MVDYMTRAREIEEQLAKLNWGLVQDEFVKQYPGDITVLKDDLQGKLATIRTDIGQLGSLKEKNFFPGNPIFDDQYRLLIKDVETIGVSLEFDINPKLEKIAQTLLTKAEESADKEDKSLLERAKEALTEAINAVADPVIKLAALAKALETVLKFFKVIA